MKPTLTADPVTGRPVPRTDPAQPAIRELLPCPELPAYMWILDEFHRLARNPWLKERKFAERVEQVTRIGRKYGLVLLVGTQSLLAPDYDNRTTLRAYLALRNLFVLRSMNKTEKAVVGDLTIYPGTLRQGGGYAFTSGDGRLSMLRVAWTKFMHPFVVGLPECPGDPDSELAVAPYMPQRPRDPAAELQDRQERLAAWRTAKLAGGGQPEAAAAGAPPLPHNSPAGRA